MSTNKILLRSDRLVTNTLKTLKRNVRELKTPQSIGADILSVQGTPSGGAFIPATPLTLTAGSSATFSFTTVPYNQTLTLWNFADDIYIDTPTDNPNYQYPNGALLVTAQRMFSKTSWLSWGDSSDLSNIRVYKIHIVNNDTSSHTYLPAFRAYLPKMLGIS